MAERDYLALTRIASFESAQWTIPRETLARRASEGHDQTAVNPLEMKRNVHPRRYLDTRPP